MRTTALLLLSLGVLAGCPGEPAAYITPARGQTAVPLDAELRVRNAAREIPPGYDIAGLIRVSDIGGEGGEAPSGPVEGLISRDGDDAVFRPVGGWRAGRRYAWTVDPLPAPAHGPTLEIPEDVVGDAAFSTADAADVLAATLDGGEVCLVLSQDDADLSADLERVSVDDAPAAVDAVTPRAFADWDPGVALPPRTVGVTCLALTPAPAAGSAIRVERGGRSFRVTLLDDTLDDAVFDRYLPEPP